MKAFSKIRMISTGGYAPSQIVSNEELAQSIDTTDAWVQENLGIKQRHKSAEDEYSSDLAYRACAQALEEANIDK